MENENSTAQNTQPTITYAGFWWRFLATIIDGFVLSFVSGIFILPIALFFGLGIATLSESMGNFEESPVFWGSMIGMYGSIISISLVISWLYNAIMESSKLQATVGKLALKIKDTDYNYQRISFARASGRYFGKYISELILWIGYIMAGFTEKKQALHDLMASCYVIKE